mmetsp:Transcript_122621/g.261686  ORF Transcript_122621/g.261686 Transcript_122621/m.261686 type:complete len:238 (-) Transcript_122621:191-904(-)
MAALRAWAATKLAYSSLAVVVVAALRCRSAAVADARGGGGGGGAGKPSGAPYCWRSAAALAAARFRCGPAAWRAAASGSRESAWAWACLEARAPALSGAYSRRSCPYSNSSAPSAKPEPCAKDSLIALISSARSSVSSSNASTCWTLILSWSFFSLSRPALIASTALSVVSACSCWSARLSTLNCAPMSCCRCPSNTFFRFMACSARCLAAGSAAPKATKCLMDSSAFLIFASMAST